MEAVTAIVTPSDDPIRYTQTYHTPLLDADAGLILCERTTHHYKTRFAVLASSGLLIPIDPDTGRPEKDFGTMSPSECDSTDPDGCFDGHTFRCTQHEPKPMCAFGAGGDPDDRCTNRATDSGYCPPHNPHRGESVLDQMIAATEGKAGAAE